jgi:hypothetical protein
VPDALSVPYQLVSKDPVVTKGLARCATVEKLELSVDGNQANCAALGGRTQGWSDYSNPQSHQCDGRADQA